MAFTISAILFCALGLGLWRATLGGMQGWLDPLARVGFLWDTKDGERKLRRGVWYAGILVPTAPLWLAGPLWLPPALIGCLALQFVWPGRDFSRFWSLVIGHGVGCALAWIALYLSGQGIISAAVLAPPLLIASTYEFFRGKGPWRNRYAEFFAGAIPGGIVAAIIFWG